MLFSQREGLAPLKELQNEDIDQETRNRLWNALDICYWSNIYSSSGNDRTSLAKLIQNYWHSFFKKPLDEIQDFKAAIRTIRDDFFTCTWFRVYEHIEFVIERSDYQFNHHFAKDFPAFCNKILDEENSAYRIVSGKLTKITSPAEIDSIEEAFAKTGHFAGVQMHLITALNLLSDRENPDYRNSIKESISAVEAICRELSDGRKAGFGYLLDILEQNMNLNRSLKAAFNSLYGYTSNADGIRHAMLEVPNLTFIDAKFMLVTCTAFINYIIGKAADLRIEIKQ